MDRRQVSNRATTPTEESGSATAMAKHSETETASIQVHEVCVPKNTTLVVSSLDLTAAQHTVQISAWSAASETPAAVKLNPAARLESTDEALNSNSSHFGSCNWSHFLSHRSEPNGVLAKPDSSIPQRRRRFEVPHFADGLTLSRYVMADLLCGEQSLAIYSDQTSAAASKLADRLTALARKGLPKFVETQVGTIVDVDSDGELTILLTSLSCSEQPESGQEPVNGCVRQSDFHDPANGFGGDIIYLDVRLADDEQLDAVFAHELTHAALFSYVRDAEDETQLIPSWLNEGLAHCVERMVRPESNNLERRLHAYFQATHRSPVVLPDGAEDLSLRRGPARAAACLFLESTFEHHCVKRPGDLFQGWSGSAIDRLQQLTGQSLSDSIADWACDCCQRYDVSTTPLDVGEPTQLTIRGTAFAAFRADEPLIVELRSETDSKLRTSIVRH